MESTGLHNAHGGRVREAAGNHPSPPGQSNEWEGDNLEADLNKEYPSSRKAGVVRYQQLLANKFTSDFEGKFEAYRKLFSTKKGRDQNWAMYEAWIQTLGRVKCTTTPWPIMKCSCTANRIQKQRRKSHLRRAKQGILGSTKACRCPKLPDTRVLKRIYHNFPLRNRRENVRVTIGTDPSIWCRHPGP